MRVRLVFGAALMGALVVSIPATAGPTEPTRQHWAADADAVCKVGYQENGRRFRRAIRLAEAGRFERGGRLIKATFRHGREVFRKVERLERPAGDEDRIQKWIDGEFRSLALAIRAGGVLADGKVNRFNRMFSRAARIDRHARRHIRGFKPEHCTS